VLVSRAAQLILSFHFCTIMSTPITRPSTTPHTTPIVAAPQLPRLRCYMPNFRPQTRVGRILSPLPLVFQYLPTDLRQRRMNPEAPFTYLRQAETYSTCRTVAAREMTKLRIPDSHYTPLMNCTCPRDDHAIDSGWLFRSPVLLLQTVPLNIKGVILKNRIFECMRRVCSGTAHLFRSLIAVRPCLRRRGRDVMLTGAYCARAHADRISG